MPPDALRRQGLAALLSARPARRRDSGASAFQGTRMGVSPHPTHNDWYRQACMALDPPSEMPAAGPQPLDLPAGVHRLCACGLSRHDWICDGAHLGSGRVFHELRLEQPTTVVLCGCGRSQRYPFCDGRHERAAAKPWWRLWF